ncbi:MAG TPA: hypothetical protein VMT19_01235 [Thermoanaerobaculaceae bacterium]|nr:hypothetical protein [Thermoanaerobaculaceae bacterium]
MRRALVLADGHIQVEAVLGALAAAGFEAVAVGSTAEIRPQVELGAAVVVMGTAGTPEADSARTALPGMPAGLRRSCVVVLVGGGPATGDGLRAFLLGADLVVAAGDAARLGELAGAAVAAKRALVAPLDPVAAGRLGG